jgi:hypothetical protein
VVSKATRIDRRTSVLVFGSHVLGEVCL